MSNEEMIVDAVVLSLQDYKENTKIIKLLTEDSTIISLFIHNFKSKNFSYRGVLQPLNQIKIKLKSKKEKYSLIECSLIENYGNITLNYNLFESISKFIKSILILEFFENSSAVYLYELLLKYLNVYNSVHIRNTKLFELYFYFQVAFCLGVKFGNFKACSQCSSINSTYFFEPFYGGVICSSCKRDNEYSLHISDKLRNLFLFFAESKLYELINNNTIVDDTTYNEIKKMINLHIFVHFNKKNFF